MNYKQLITAVENIDPKAAEYMRAEAIKLDSFNDTFKLSYAFVWGFAPQGHRFWNELDKKLLPFYVRTIKELFSQKKLSAINKEIVLDIFDEITERI